MHVVLRNDCCVNSLEINKKHCTALVRYIRGIASRTGRVDFVSYIKS